MRHVFFPCVVLLVLFQSCVKNNPDPSWIEITEWQLNSNPNAQSSTGELTESITNVKLYVNDELIGIFELPCKIPVLLSGPSTITLLPVVLNNGISATKKVYPFLESYVIDTVLTQNESITISPETRYFSNTEFWIEDFESTGSSITQNLGSSVTLDIISGSPIAESFNGSKFGRITLDETNNFWVGYTLNEQLDLPRGEEVYLEIDYHNTNRITTGLLGVSATSNDSNPIIQLNPQADSEVEWKKIYVDLREVVSGSIEAEYFELTLNALLDEEDSQGEINIDNIKIVYFQ